MNVNSDDTRTLEEIIDRYTLSDVIAALADIAYAKAQHIAEAWQDKQIALPWERAGRLLGLFSTRLTRDTGL